MHCVSRVMPVHSAVLAAHTISSNAHCCLVQTMPPPGCSFPCISNAQRPSVKSGNAEDCDRPSRVGLDDLGLTCMYLSLWSPSRRSESDGITGDSGLFSLGTRNANQGLKHVRSLLVEGADSLLQQACSRIRSHWLSGSGHAPRLPRREAHDLSDQHLA